MEAELVAIAETIPPQLPARRAAYAYLVALLDLAPPIRDGSAWNVAIGQESVAYAWLKTEDFEDVATRMRAVFRRLYPKAWLPH